MRDRRDVAEPERLAVGEDRNLLDRRDAFARAPLTRSGTRCASVWNSPAGGQRVLLGERVEQRRKGTPSVASLAWLNSTKMRSPCSP